MAALDQITDLATWTAGGDTEDATRRHELGAFLRSRRERMTPAECTAVSPAVQTILQQLEPLPACVTNGRYDILAYNRIYATLVADLDAVPAEDRNTMVLNLTYPAWRKAIVDPEDAVVRCVATFRGNMAQHVADPVWKALVRRLSSESEEFVEIWERYEVCGVENRVKSLVNEKVGILRLHFTNLWLTPGRDTRIVVYSAADEETEQRLATLAADVAGSS